MYGRSSDLAQARSRRAAELAPTNGGIQASDAFKSEAPLSDEAEEVFRCTMLLQEAQERLTRMNARGLEKRHPDRLEAVARFQEASTQLGRVKGRAKARHLEAQRERDLRWERAFVDTAREMLASPVYDRIVIATSHRIGER